MGHVIASTDQLTVVVDGATVRIGGDVDLAARSSILEAFALVPESELLALDLEHVAFIDSAGLAAILFAAQRPTGVRIAASSRAVDWLLEFAGCADLLQSG